MFKNLFFDKNANKIHLWEQIKGEDFYDVIPWVPYCFEHDPKLREGAVGVFKAPDGKLVKRKRFKKSWDYFTFMKGAKSNYNVYETELKPETQFLVDRYYAIPDEEMVPPKLKIYCVDIEVHIDEGFPIASKADGEVVLITVIDHYTYDKYTWGSKPFTLELPEHTYFYCQNEKDLLTRFFNWFHENPPNVLTGWNVYQYDTLYLFKRSEKLFGKDKSPHHKLSPVNQCSLWRGTKDINLDIAGVDILDMMDLYKKFAPKPLESYRLDYVANYELEKGKRKWSELTRNWRDLYHHHWDKFVEYNIIDAKRVSELEDKLGYIGLAQQMSLFTRVPTKFYQAQTSMIEGAMLTYFRRKNMCAPKMVRGDKEGFVGAVVKDPQQGQYNWVVDLDITSAYPTAVSIMNMSGETHKGKILGFTEEKIIEHVRKREFPEFSFRGPNGSKKKMENGDLEAFNKALKNQVITISPIGAVFNNVQEGHMASVIKEFFFRRKKVKELAFALKKEDGNKDEIKRLNTLQTTIKLMINSMYGTFTAPWSRYFNQDIGESVTSCGRHMILSGEKYVNEILNQPHLRDDLMLCLREIKGGGTGEYFEPNPNKDFVIYIDTDSLFFSVETWANYFAQTGWHQLTDDEKEEMTIKVSKCVERYVNEHSLNRTQHADFGSNREDLVVEFKQEIVAKSAMFIQKKKYSLWKINEEGIKVDDMHTRGMEIVKSDTPSAVSPRLKEVMEMVLKSGTDDDIRAKSMQHITELLASAPEELSANISVNNTAKYIKDGRPTKGTPWHVKGANNYRILIEMWKLQNKYESLLDGEKCKVVYLKPNSYGMDTLSFKIWPVELEQYGIKMDIIQQVKKHYVDKIADLLKPLGRIHVIKDIQDKMNDKLKAEAKKVKQDAKQKQNSLGL